MTEPVQSPAQDLLEGVDLEALAHWLEERRWYASKSRHVTGIELDECVSLGGQPPLLLALIQARFASG